MTDKDKLKEIKKLADAMYYAAFNLTTDASRLKKAMDEYHQFIIQEYCKEEPVSGELEEVAKHYLYSNILYDDVYVGNPTDKDCIEMFKAGAKWQKEQMMANATEVTVHIDAGGYPYIPQVELYDYDKDIPLAKEGDKYKVVFIEED
jgi:uncharacterized protein YwqG